ncbi:hypothetical protein GCM10010988_38770 [Cnuibacter physcomitrellae]|nr:hypothetical protein GCM10010988_38770 [Cnuibacter physcomitrellae]
MHDPIHGHSRERKPQKAGNATAELTNPQDQRQDSGKRNPDNRNIARAAKRDALLNQTRLVAHRPIPGPL